MPRTEPMLRLSDDGRQVIDENGELRYEARTLGGRTVYVAPGSPVDMGGCSQTGVKMACRRVDAEGTCEEWATIDVCEAWAAVNPRRPSTLLDA